MHCMADSGNPFIYFIFSFLLHGSGHARVSFIVIIPFALFPRIWWFELVDRGMPQWEDPSKLIDINPAHAKPFDSLWTNENGRDEGMMFERVHDLMISYILCNLVWMLADV